MCVRVLHKGPKVLSKGSTVWKSFVALTILTWVFYCACVSIFFRGMLFCSKYVGYGRYGSTDAVCEASCDGFDPPIILHIVCSLQFAFSKSISEHFSVVCLLMDVFSVCIIVLIITSIKRLRSACRDRYVCWSEMYGNVDIDWWRVSHKHNAKSYMIGPRLPIAVCWKQEL